MAVCKFEGNRDMYGLGIRLGYYLQWYGVILARWIAPSELKNLALFIDLFVAGSFMALVISAASDVKDLEPVETYIVLLLMFGSYLALVPIYLWRLLTACDPYWDPSRYPLVNIGALSANFSFILLMGTLIFQYWFWFDRVPDLDGYNCEQYGFLLSQVRLNSKVSVALNALMYFWLGAVCLYILALKIRSIAGYPDPMEQRQPRTISRSHKERHIEFLQNLDTWFKFIVTIIATLAIELTISWNEIRGANTLRGAGNTIAFVIGISAVVRILYVSMLYSDDDSSDGDSYYSYRSRAQSHRGPSGPPPVRQMPSRREKPHPVRPMQPVHIDREGNAI